LLKDKISRYTPAAVLVCDLLRVLNIILLTFQVRLLEGTRVLKVCCASIYKLSDIPGGHFDLRLLILVLLLCLYDRMWTGTFRKD